jgi:hypothetical protein
MSISGPTLRMHAERIRDLMPVVVRLGREASERLGYVSDPEAATPVAAAGVSRKKR